MNSYPTEITDSIKVCPKRLEANPPPSLKHFTAEIASPVKSKRPTANTDTTIILNLNDNPSSSNRTKQEVIKSSKFRIARLLQRITGTGRNILIAKYKHPITGRVTYLMMFSMGMGTVKLTMPKNEEGRKQRKRGHTEGMIYAVMLNEKINIPDGSGGYKELQLKNNEIQYISSTNEACPGRGSENCKTEVLPKLLEKATHATFYYNNSYSAGVGSAGGFKINTNEHYNGEEDSETDSESEADFYAIETIPNTSKNRMDPTPPLLQAQPLRDFVKSGDFVKKSAGKRSWKNWERNIYTSNKKAKPYPNANRSLYKQFLS